ncbi:MAG: DNA repair protein RecO [Christensenellales bacterium]
MATIKTDGIILRYANYGDYNRMLTLFSPQYGKLGFSARSCRKANAKMIACLDQFCYGEYVLYEKNGHYTVTQCELKENFYALRTDLERMSYATYFLNLCEEFIQEGKPAPRIFALLLEALSYYSFAKTHARVVTICCVLKLMDITGYRPNLEYCAHCGAAAEGNMVFDACAGGVVCAACQKGEPIALDTIRVMRYILEMDTRKIRSVQMDEGLADTMLSLLMQYVEKRIERCFPSQEFIMTILK